MAIDLLLPSGWIRTSISDVAEVDLGKTPKKTQYVDSGDYKIVKFRDVAYEGITWTQSDKGFVDPAAIGALKELNIGDVLITSSAHSSEHIGRKVAYLGQLPEIFEKVFYVGELLKVRADRRALAPKYSFYFFLSRNGYRAIQEKVKGVHLTSGEGRKIEIPLPPLNEQHRIVAKIEELFSELDKGIESLKTAQAKLNVYRQAVLKHAFEGKLTAQWREENKDKLETPEQLLARIKKEREARYEQRFKEWKAAVKEWEDSGKSGRKPPKPQKPKNLLLLAVSPVHNPFWARLFLDELAVEAVLGKMLDREKNTGTPRHYLGNINLRWGKFDLENLKMMKVEESEIGRYRLAKGDLVICEGGEPGRCAVWEGQESIMLIQKALHRVRFTESYSPYFAYYFMTYAASSGLLSPNFTGSTIKHLTGKGLGNVLFLLCTLAEQNQIVHLLDRTFNLCDELDRQIEREIRRSNSLRQSVLSKAFSGQLVAQDPHDEPASVLLGRIRAEREKAAKNNPSKKTQRRKTTA